MTPQEQARKLVENFYLEVAPEGKLRLTFWVMAKSCALLAVKEILEATGLEGWDDTQKFWTEVKFEINKL